MILSIQNRRVSQKHSQMPDKWLKIIENDGDYFIDQSFLYFYK